MTLTKTLSTLTLMLCALATLAAEPHSFESDFAPRTLRLDYTLAGDSSSQEISLRRQATMAGWAGRRAHLNELPLAGDARLTMTDAATGDTIYQTSFSTLFHEWLSTPEARQRARTFDHAVLLPMPLRDTRIALTLTGQRREPMAEMDFIFSPDDILVERLDTRPSLPHRYIHRSPLPLENAIDIAILAEGYRAEEMDSFYVHAARAAEELLSYAPYNDKSERFNIIAVASPSAESGVSIPRLGQWKDTAFGSHFSTFYSDRYLTAPSVARIHDALVNIPYEHIIILANTDEYGGGGIYNSYTLTAARNRYMRPVVVHEFGHSFGGLADEYFYDGDVMEDSYPTDIEPWNPNITTLVDFESKWKPMMPEATPVTTPVADAAKYPIGLYEGGGYSSKGVYRPADECRMRNNTYPAFCPVCTAALARLIDFYTR
ncbi:MAG: IgA Peptidase M64 [Pseudoflavonifractor sp.]|nr:IgA Peptidase M64 [Alloprevotella sp.]MCM1116186.1 IgA Peptidase M64 [Pseudoflavonifractor sp.]